VHSNKISHVGFTLQKFFSLKKLFLLSASVWMIAGLSSCQKVIELDLKNVEKKYVVEANLSDQPGSCKVLLTQTKDFDESNTFPGVSGAVVQITDNNNAPVLLTETAAGVYEAPALTGVPGHNYQLSVQVNGQTFSATSVVPQLVGFDSLYISERTVFSNTNKYATVKYTDPAGVQNAYRFQQYLNGRKEKALFVRDDNSNDGLTIDRVLLYFYGEEEKEERAIKSGDTLRIDMMCITYPMYKYWISLDQGAFGDNNSTPGNPVSNINGGALGYFSTHTLRSRTIIVP
jgi:hypothetical protein